jgi:hypothetical protein
MKGERADTPDPQPIHGVLLKDGLGWPRPTTDLSGSLSRRSQPSFCWRGRRLTPVSASLLRPSRSRLVPPKPEGDTACLPKPKADLSRRSRSQRRTCPAEAEAKGGLVPPKPKPKADLSRRSRRRRRKASHFYSLCALTVTNSHENAHLAVTDRAVSGV